MEETDYTKYRGKCLEYAQREVEKDTTLRLVRGHYYDAAWGRQEHWWCEKSDGTIVDPTVKQFPTKGKGVYEEFDGMVECEICGKQMHEDDAYYIGRYHVCSDSCARALVGV